MMRSLYLLPVLMLVAACTPTVKVEAPDKPIVIDLNVKIEHKVKVEIDRDLDKVMKDDNLF
ncbi:MAG: hypothetical protein K0R63_865 [Rickettsiales bacterium]|jgi:hypothetical protein|nr:hypothetical protein [Rickettsiales bacterium]